MTAKHVHLKTPNLSNHHDLCTKTIEYQNTPQPILSQLHTYIPNA